MEIIGVAEKLSEQSNLLLILWIVIVAQSAAIIVLAREVRAAYKQSKEESLQYLGFLKDFDSVLTTSLTTYQQALSYIMELLKDIKDRQ
jgi:hypothetical protein